MRISVLVPLVPLVGSLLLAGGLAAPVRADSRPIVKRHRVTAIDPTEGLVPRDRASPIADRPGAGASATSLTTGDLRFTGAARREWPERSDRPESPEPGDRPAPAPGSFLAARDVAAEVRPYAPEIERCYLERLGDPRRAGHLDLRFVIASGGAVVSLSAAAPGLPAKTARQVESCIRQAVGALHFPERRNDTTAIVPYYFQHTSAPGAGPQLSCWNPRGC
ncbi:MAG TPA: AgmX/PglI C-terminal domain-containing protein [Kofleriaceae bacterium]